MVCDHLHLTLPNPMMHFILNWKAGLKTTCQVIKLGLNMFFILLDNFDFHAISIPLVVTVTIFICTYVNTMLYDCQKYILNKGCWKWEIN